MAFQAPQAPAAAPGRHQNSLQANITADRPDFFLDLPSSPTYSRTHYNQSLAAPEEQEEWVVFSPSVTVEPSNFTITGSGTHDDEGEHSVLWTEDENASRLYSETIDNIYDTGDLITEEEEIEEDENHLVYDDGYSGAEHDDEDSITPFQDIVNPVLLPTHDGRGLFPESGKIETEAEMMKGLGSLEESLRLLAGRCNIFEDTNDVNARINKWRLEHSNAFMEELEELKSRPTKRAKRRMTSDQANLEAMEASMMYDDEEESSTMDESAATITTETENKQTTKENEELPETFWRRVTRSFMRDLMGIDDTMLEVIFGESLPEAVESTPSTSTGTAHQHWDRNLLERIARELGVLLQHYTIHPTQGAFSTYNRWSMPVPSTKTKPKSQKLDGTKTPTQVPRIIDSRPSSGTDSTQRIHFQPTLSNLRPAPLTQPAAPQPAPTVPSASVAGTAIPKSEAQLRKEYWEQELGVRVFFSYLKSRFSFPPLSNNSSSESINTPPPPPPAVQAPQPPVAQQSPRLRLASRPIYHQHPLLKSSSRISSHRRTRSSASTASVGSALPQAPAAGTGSWGLFGLGGYRNGSSCASQSTRTSGRRMGKGKGKGSVGGGKTGGATKEFYWEVETSVGSAGGGGSVGVGAWGEI